MKAESEHYQLSQINNLTPICQEGTGKRHQYLRFFDHFLFASFGSLFFEEFVHACNFPVLMFVKLQSQEVFYGEIIVNEINFCHNHRFVAG